MAEDKMQRTVVLLPSKDHQALQAISEKTLAPVSALIRLAVSEFLSRRKDK